VGYLTDAMSAFHALSNLRGPESVSDMTYSEKLKDPRWQRLRLELMEAAGWMCQECGSLTKTLEIHHIVYLRCDPWDYPRHLYQVLCCDCHDERQELTDKAVGALRLAIAKVHTQILVRRVQDICAQAMLAIEFQS